MLVQVVGEVKKNDLLIPTGDNSGFARSLRQSEAKSGPETRYVVGKAMKNAAYGLVLVLVSGNTLAKIPWTGMIYVFENPLLQYTRVPIKMGAHRTEGGLENFTEVCLCPIFV